jgi:hypothetical protein
MFKMIGAAGLYLFNGKHQNRLFKRGMRKTELE